MILYHSCRHIQYSVNAIKNGGKSCRHIKKVYFCRRNKNRGVAQLASALAWGARGRKFESFHPDFLKKRKRVKARFFCYKVST